MKTEPPKEPNDEAFVVGGALFELPNIDGMLGCCTWLLPPKLNAVLASACFSPNRPNIEGGDVAVVMAGWIVFACPRLKTEDCAAGVGCTEPPNEKDGVAVSLAGAAVFWPNENIDPLGCAAFVFGANDGNPDGAGVAADCPKAGLLVAPKLKELAVVTGTAGIGFADKEFCEEPKVKPELAVVVGAVTFDVLLKLNPIPLAVVVSGFWTNAFVLARFPVLVPVLEIAVLKLLPVVVAITGFAPKLNDVADGVWKLKDGVDVVVSVGTEAAAEGITDNVLEPPNPIELALLSKLKPLATFGASLLLPKENPLVVLCDVNDGAAARDAKALVVDGTDDATTVGSGLAIGVKLIIDLLGSIDGTDVGCVAFGVVKIAKGETLPDEIVVVGLTGDIGELIVVVAAVTAGAAFPKLKLSSGFGASDTVLGAVVADVVAGVIATVGTAGASTVFTGLTSELVVNATELKGRALDDGVEIGDAVLDVVTVVKEMEAATAESTESFGNSLVGDLNPSLSPDSIIDSFSFSRCRMTSRSPVSVGTSRGFTKFTFFLPSSSSGTFR